MKRAWLLIASLLLLASGSGTAVTAATSPTSPVGGTAVVAPTGIVGHTGRWLIDREGRVVIIHGMNVPSKTLPAYPAALGFGDADAALLAESGFNAVRLTVERYALEPHPGQFDDNYLAHIAETVAVLAGHGVLSLIDFHQDEFGPVFMDNGYPSWMTMTDGRPNLWEVGFPEQYFANPALEQAFDHLWANDVGPDGHRLQDDDVAMLSHAAAYLGTQPGVLGFEIINEPWPGTIYPTCTTPVVGCPIFDKGPFSAYYRKLIPAVRKVDPTRLIFYEPVSTFNQGVPTSVVPPPDPELGFAFHDYPLCSAVVGAAAAVAQSQCSPANGQEDAMVLNNAAAHSAATGNALLETEFGATTDLPTIQRQLAEYDAAMMPWMWWSYTHYIDPYAPNGQLEPPTSTNIDQTMLATLARPYPQLVAGTPEAWSFDPSTKVFTFRYTPRRADGAGAFAPGSETLISVPAIQYPLGYVATITGGQVVSAPDASLLRVHAAASSGVVTVAVTPR